MAFQDPKVLGSSAVIQIVSMTLVEGTGANAGTYGNIKASSFETFSLMIRSRLLAVTYLDQKLSQLIDQQPGTRDAIGLAQLLIKTFCVEEKLNGVCGEVKIFTSGMTRQIVYCNFITLCDGGLQSWARFPKMSIFCLFRKDIPK